MCGRVVFFFVSVDGSVCAMGVDLFWAGKHESKSKILGLRWEGENNGLRSEQTQKEKNIRRKKVEEKGKNFFYGKSSDD